MPSFAKQIPLLWRIILLTVPSCRDSRQLRGTGGDAWGISDSGGGAD